MTPFSKPYIGVTGYTTVEQINRVHRAVASHVGDHRLMDGVLIWSHDVNAQWSDDRVSVPVNLAKRFMAVDEAERLFAAPSGGSLRMIHLRTAVPVRLDEQLADCTTRFGVHVGGFQINWLAQPSPGELADFRSVFDAQRLAAGLSPSALVLQLHPRVLENAEKSAGVLKYVEPYVNASAISHVLYDPSGGQGVAFDPQVAVAMSRELRRAFPELNLGVAGGLSPDNIEANVSPVWREDPTISIDVEGRVRTTDDDLDISLAARFVSKAQGLNHRLRIDLNATDR